MKHLFTLLLSCLIFILILVLSYVAYVHFFKNYDDKNNHDTTVQILLGNTLLNASLFSLDNNQEIKAIPFAEEGSIVSRTRNKNIGLQASIVTPPDAIGGSIVLETDEATEVLSSPSSIKDWISISPDGQYLAYTELNLSFGSTLYSDNVTDWNVKLLHRTSGEIRDIGVGYGPHIVNSDDGLVVIFTAPNGVGSYHISSNQQYVSLPEFTVDDVVHAGRVSPDGTMLLVYNPITKTYSLFSIITALPITVSAIAGIPDALELTALTNEYVYGVARDQSTNERKMVRYVISEFRPFEIVGEVLYEFSEEQIPYEIIP